MRAIWHGISPAPPPRPRTAPEAAAEAGKGTTREILADIIGFPTVSHHPNRQLIDCCGELLNVVGVDSHIIENDEGTKANLFATIGPVDRTGVMLSGHTDVVPVDGQAWTRPAFEATEEAGRIFGRGTADMKGFVAAALNVRLAAGL